MMAEAKIFWWPNINRDNEEKVKTCIACLASAEKKPKIPMYVSRDEEGDVTNYLVMAKTKAEEKVVDKHPKKQNSAGKKEERAQQIRDKITPKNGHCRRDVDGKYIWWNEILRDILNGKLKIIQNQKIRIGIRKRRR